MPNCFIDEVVYEMKLKYMQLKFGNGSSEFHFGQEICNFPEILRRWQWGGGGNIRRACVIVQIFLVFYFSDKIYKIGVLHLKNFHFSLSIFKNGVKNGVKTLFCMIAVLHPTKEGQFPRDPIFFGQTPHP